MAPRTIGDATRTAALDASVLINFLCLERLDILAAIGDIDFVVPEQVVEETTVPQQIQTLNAAIRGGQLRSERSTDHQSALRHAEDDVCFATIRLDTKPRHERDPIPLRTVRQ